MFDYELKNLVIGFVLIAGVSAKTEYTALVFIYNSSVRWFLALVGPGRWCCCQNPENKRAKSRLGQLLSTCHTNNRFDPNLISLVLALTGLDLNTLHEIFGPQLSGNRHNITLDKYRKISQNGYWIKISTFSRSHFYVYAKLVEFWQGLIFIVELRHWFYLNS